MLLENQIMEPDEARSFKSAQNEEVRDDYLPVFQPPDKLTHKSDIVFQAKRTQEAINPTPMGIDTSDSAYHDNLVFLNTYHSADYR